MRYEQLFYLSELSKYPSINLASIHLNLTQQSLSNSIKSLENELDCTILTRTYQGISFTNEGEKVLSVARKIIREWDLLKIELNSKKHITNPELHIVASASVVSSKLIQFCNRFIDIYPEISLRCDSDSAYNIINSFDDYLHYDLVFFTRIKKNNKNITQYPPYIKFIPLSTTKFYIMTNINSQDASKSAITESELKTMNLRMFINYDQINTNEQKENFLHFKNLLGIENNLIYSDSISYCMQGLLDNQFNVLVAEGIEHNLFLHPQTKAIPIKIAYEFQFGYLTLRNINLNSNAQKLIDLILESYNA